MTCPSRCSISARSRRPDRCGRRPPALRPEAHPLGPDDLGELRQDLDARRTVGPGPGGGQLDASGGADDRGVREGLAVLASICWAKGNVAFRRSSISSRACGEAPSHQEIIGAPSGEAEHRVGHSTAQAAFAEVAVELPGAASISGLLWVVVTRGVPRAMRAKIGRSMPTLAKPSQTHHTW